MGLVLSCSQCQASLSVPDDMLGKFVRCPNCSLTFTAALPQAPRTGPPRLPPPLPLEERRPRIVAPEYPDRRRDDDDYDDRDNEIRERFDPAWLTVKSGLNSMLVGALIVIVTVAVCFFIVMILGISEAGGGRRNNEGLTALVGGTVCLGILIALGGGVTNLVGKFMCMAAPDPRIRGLMVGHVVALAANVVLAVILFVVFIGFTEAPGRPNAGDRRNMQIALALLGALQALIFLGSAILLNLFLKGIAQTFEQRSLASGCGAFIVFETFWLLGLSGISILFLALDPGNNIRQEGKFVAWLLGLIVVGGGGGVVSLIWRLFLERACHHAIRRAQEISRRRYHD